MKQSKIIILIAVIAFFSCSKDEETKPIVGTWQKNKVEKKINSGNWSVVSLPCQQDDTEEYSANGTWVLYDGANQCSPGSGITNGTWRLSASDTKVVYTYSGIPGEYESTVESITDSQMILIQSVGDINNTQIRYSYAKK